MAVLQNDAQNLRFFLEFVDREVLPLVPGQPAPPAEAARLLGTTGVEFFDRRDQGFWPFLRLPVLYATGQDVPDLLKSLKDLCALKVDGFAFRTGMQGELALQLGRQSGGGFIVEVGIDLAPYLLETAGVQGEPGRELAMFRYTTSTAEIVKFADQLKTDLQKLPPVRNAASPSAP